MKIKPIRVGKNRNTTTAALQVCQSLQACNDGTSYSSKSKPTRAKELVGKSKKHKDSRPGQSCQYLNIRRTCTKSYIGLTTSCYMCYSQVRASTMQEISKRAGCIFVYNDNTSNVCKSKPTRGGEISKRVGWQKQEAQR